MPPWTSHNTPQIELIQYGRRIGKRSITYFLNFTLLIRKGGYSQQSLYKYV